MGRDLNAITQYELTSYIALHINEFDLKDGSIKLLIFLSAFYPNILQTRKSLLKHFATATLDRALKELELKEYIYKTREKIIINLMKIYQTDEKIYQIEEKKVINLRSPHTCNKQEITKNTNKQTVDVAIPSFLSGLGLNETQKCELLEKHSEDELKKYAEYVKNSKTANPIAYFKWCLKEKPELSQTTSETQQKPKYNNDIERYTAYLTSPHSNWINNKQLAETFLVNTSQFDLRNEKTLKDVICIMLLWKFNIEDYNVLSLIDEAAANNQDFKNKTVQLTAQAMHDLKSAQEQARKQTIERAQSQAAAC